MRSPVRRPQMQTAVVSAMALVAAAWFITVPGLVGATNFIAVAGILLGVAWVVMTTYWNGRSTEPVSQLVPVTENVSVGGRRRARR
jgi:hypothetical protein